MQIIGLSGYARSGKDTAAKFLAEEFGFTCVAFADKLREVLYALNPIVIPSYNEGLGIHPSERYHPLLLQEVIDHYGWDGYKNSPYSDEIRRLLQRLGTEAGRETLYDSIWVDAALNGHPEDAKLVITDLRFPNEYDAIKARGGDVWRIGREGVGPANDHKSEILLDNHEFDLILMNNGTLLKFYKTVMKAHDAYCENKA